MGRGSISGFSGLLAAVMLTQLSAADDSFRHVGDYVLKAHFKITGAKITQIPIKPIAFKVYTDGVRVRLAAEGDEESRMEFDVYRSDGIGRQRGGGGALEVVPGLQATSQAGGMFRHLRLSGDSLTITSFPGVSDQTIVSHAVAAETIEDSDTRAHSPTSSQ